MVDLAHKEVLPFLALLAFGNVLNRTTEAYELAVGPGTLKTSKSKCFAPAGQRRVDTRKPDRTGLLEYVEVVKSRLGQQGAAVLSASSPARVNGRGRLAESVGGGMSIET
jgi:hypothetical protein